MVGSWAFSLWDQDLRMEKILSQEMKSENSPVETSLVDLCNAIFLFIESYSLHYEAIMY